MILTNNFRRQHDELVKLMEQISGYFTKDKLNGNEQELCKQLANLSGKLKVHLVMEDQFLYPKLIASDNTAIKDLAKQYSSEMGSIRGEFEKYISTWLSFKAVSDAPDRFIFETRKIFDTLSERINKEGKELYALAEKCS